LRTHNYIIQKMKNIIILLVTVVTISFASCSKSAKLNKKLDGTWEVVKIDGSAPPAGTSFEFTFSKEKGGKGEIEIKTVIDFPPFPKMTEIEKGTYVLTKDSEIKITIEEDGKKEENTAKVLEYSKTDLKLEATEDGEKVITELKKKD
jgi:hypothetical protein